MDTLVLFIIAIILLLIELATISLTTIWFAVGAFAACILSTVSDDYILEGIVFIIVSVATLVVCRPSIARKFNSKRHMTNVDSLIGKVAKVSETINNKEFTGTAVLNGQEWTARAQDDSVIIEAGSDVEIVEISGVKLIVIKKEA